MTATNMQSTLEQRATLIAAAAVVAGTTILAGCVPELDEPDVVFARAPYSEEVREIRFGMTFDGLLMDAGVDAAQRHDIVLAYREEHNPQRLRAGTQVSLLRYRGDEAVVGLRVPLDMDNAVMLDRGPEGRWWSSTVMIPTTIDTVYASGEIQTDLWSAIMNDRLLSQMPYADRVNFIDRLDKVFQWRVDFSRAIRVGDTYRFVFEREKRPDGSMRSGSLLAAELVNVGKAHYAILFDPNGDGEGTWYDLEGESVRRSFLMRPIRFSRISSRFSNSRFHPILRRWRAHRGVDYAADAGTPIEATADGVVTRRGWSDTYGRVIDVRHSNGFATRYAHMQGFASGTSVGSRVTQGQTIGYVGMTGMATGPHLHYEMHVNGRRVDPLAIEMPADDPVPADALNRWEFDKQARLALLMTVPLRDQLPTRRADE